MDKRGFFDDWVPKDALMYIQVLFVTAVVLVILTYFGLRISYGEASVADGLEERLLAQRFLLSDDCFAVFDLEIQRAKPLVLNASRFSQETIDECYPTENHELPAFTLKLESLSGTTLGGPLETKNWDGKSDFTLSYPVIIHDITGVEIPGRLIVNAEKRK